MSTQHTAPSTAMVQKNLPPSAEDVLRDSGKIEMSFRFCTDGTVDAFARVNDYHKSCGIGKPTALDAAKAALDQLFTSS